MFWNHPGLGGRPCPSPHCKSREGSRHSHEARGVGTLRGVTEAGIQFKDAESSAHTRQSLLPLANVKGHFLLERGTFCGKFQGDPSRSQLEMRRHSRVGQRHESLAGAFEETDVHADKHGLLCCFTLMPKARPMGVHVTRLFYRRLSQSSFSGGEGGALDGTLGNRSR